MTQPSMLDLPEFTHRPVRRSSVLTFQAEAAKLKGRAESVYLWLRKWEKSGRTPPTTAELTEWVHGYSPTDLTLFMRRGMSDLCAKGIVETHESDDRKCRVSGRKCCVWRVRVR